MRVKKKTILGISFRSIVKAVEFSYEVLYQVSLKVQQNFFIIFNLKMAPPGSGFNDEFFLEVQNGRTSCTPHT